MRLKDIANERLYSQQIKLNRLGSPSELVSYFGAIQAQDYLGAKWSLGLRLKGFNDKEVEKSLKDKKIVRTWAIRGTLHFLAASDISWILTLISPRIISRNLRRYKELGLDENTLQRSNQVLQTTLNENNQFKRTELLNILEQNNISTEGQRGAYILQRASLDGLICQINAENNNAVFISTDKISTKPKIKREDALKELAKRYFTSHGPATLKDFVWWSGLLVKDAKIGLNALKSMEKKNIGGNIYFMKSINMENIQDSHNVSLLPGFDEYLLSYKDRSASIDEDTKKRLIPTNGLFRPSIILDGHVVGTWKRIIKKDKVLMSLNLFKIFNSNENEVLNTEIDNYSKFLDMPLEIV
jgi:hypothetical protein